MLSYYYYFEMVSLRKSFLLTLFSKKVSLFKKVPPPQNLSYISHNDKTWHSYKLPKQDPKNT